MFKSFEAGWYMMHFRCECLTLCGCLQNYVNALSEYSKGSREWIISREKNRNEDKIKTHKYLPHNDIGLTKHNYAGKNIPEKVYRGKGRPIGTHNTVIGRNKIDMRRYDYVRYTRDKF